MRSMTVAAVATSALILGACGGSGSKQANTASTPKASSNGGVVAGQPTEGLLGPAITIAPQGTKIVGKVGPLSPKENRPTDAQQGVAGGVACTSTSASPSRSNLHALSATILCLLNAERAAKGLPSLHSNGGLGRAAQGWANRMVAGRFFAHEAGSSSPLSRIRRIGYVHGSWQIGENIAWGSGVLSTPRAIVNGWMHSPGHRANILHGAFRDIGIGIKLGAPGRGLTGGAVYVTDFGRHS